MASSKSGGDLVNITRFWAVFDEHDSLWLCSIRRTRTAAIKAWLKDGNYRGRYARWATWKRGGYSTGAISIHR